MKRLLLVAVLLLCGSACFAESMGQKFGLGAAISTVIFLLVAAISFVQIRATKIAQDEKR